MTPEDILLHRSMPSLFSHYQRSFPLKRWKQIQRDTARHFTGRGTLEHRALNGMSLSKPSPQSSEHPEDEEAERR